MKNLKPKYIVILSLIAVLASTFVFAYFSADYNQDGFVNSSDLDILADGYNSDYDVSDLGDLATHFGASSWNDGDSAPDEQEGDPGELGHTPSNSGQGGLDDDGLDDDGYMDGDDLADSNNDADGHNPQASNDNDNSQDPTNNHQHDPRVYRFL